MPRQVTKASQNRYCQARLEAAKYNDRFASRASAAEEITAVMTDSLHTYAPDITRPPTDVIALLTDAYKAPERILSYFSPDCPLC